MIEFEGYVWDGIYWEFYDWIGVILNNLVLKNWLKYNDFLVIGRELLFLLM